MQRDISFGPKQMNQMNRAIEAFLQCATERDALGVISHLQSANELITASIRAEWWVDVHWFIDLLASMLRLVREHHELERLMHAEVKTHEHQQIMSELKNIGVQF